MIIKLVLGTALYAFIFHVINTSLPQLGLQIINTSAYSNMMVLIILGAIFWIINNTINKMLKLATAPLSLLTLGLSSLVINIILLYFFALVIQLINIGIIIELGTIIQIILLSILLSIASFFTKILD